MLFAVKIAPSALASLITGVVLAAVPGWITDAGTVAAVIVSMFACAAVIYRTVSRAVDHLWHRLIEDAVAEMPDAMRQAFLLVRVKQLSYKEAADRLGIGVGTVHTQLARASQRLRQVVDRYRTDALGASAPETRRNP